MNNKRVAGRSHVARLDFKIEPSKNSNDHQVRILVDGKDILETMDNSLLGIDPIEFFAQKSLRRSGRLLIGRCGCGVVGCGNVQVVVTRGPNIEWLCKYPKPQHFIFGHDQYDRSVEAAKSDTTWETPERTAERLVSKVDFSKCLRIGLEFEWASARMARDKITVCFRKQGRQVLYDAGWDHREPAEAVEAVREMLTRLCFDRADEEIV